IGPGYAGAVGAIPPQVLEELFTAPPSAFTKERNARAAALKKAGRHDAAEALRRLRRPNASLWATNQLGRLDAKRLAAFIDAVGDLRRTQLRDPRAAGEALRRQRAALDALLEAAGKHLADSGLNATPEVLRRISNTLQGAAGGRRASPEGSRGPGGEAGRGAPEAQRDTAWREGRTQDPARGPVVTCGAGPSPSLPCGPCRRAGAAWAPSRRRRSSGTRRRSGSRNWPSP